MGVELCGGRRDGRLDPVCVFLSHLVMGGRLRPCSILGGPSVLGLPVDCGRIKDCTGIAVGFWIGILQSCRNGTTDGPPGLALFYIWRAVGSPIATDCTRISELC